MKRAAQILGLGKAGIFSIPVDERFRLRPEALPETFARARSVRDARSSRWSRALARRPPGAFNPLEPVGGLLP